MVGGEEIVILDINQGFEIQQGSGLGNNELAVGVNFRVMNSTASGLPSVMEFCPEVAKDGCGP